MRRLLLPMLILTTLLVASCGARSSLSLGDDAGATDGGGARDAGPDARMPEAGPPDAGPPDSGPPSDRCANDAPCSGAEVCRAADGLVPDDLAPMPLRCGARFDGLPDGAACIHRDECDRGLCALAGTCLRPCVDGTDCAVGELCRSVFVPTSRSSMQPVDACVADVVTAEGVVTTVEPGLFVEPDIPSFDPVELDTHTLVVYGGEPDAFPLLAEVMGPGGERIFDFTAIGSTPDWGLGPLAMGGFVTVLYPNGPRTPPPGVYELGLAGFGGATPTRRTIARRSGPGTRIELDFYLAGGNRWTSPDGEIPTGLDLAIESARTILGSVGIELGDIRVHELVGETRARMSVLRGAVPPFDAPAALPELYALSVGARRPAVHVFLTREIDGVLGIASGIPGVQILPGTAASGIAISTDLVPINELGLVLVHEMGHYLGLFHTSEAEGTLSDPYDDTAECTSVHDDNGDGLVDPFECAGRGAENVMFWAGSGMELSAQQADVLRGSPLMAP